jgi:hypothetical protein
VSMKVVTRQIHDVTIVDLSGQIKLGEGSFRSNIPNPTKNYN